MPNITGVSYVSLDIFKCEMCHTHSFSKKRKFLWIGHITKINIVICSKCAKREVGKNKWNQLLEEANGK